MKNFKYFMPTKIFVGENCVLNNHEIFGQYGRKALIVTGKSSAKKNGALNDCIEALNKNDIEYIIFDDIEENPSIETVEKTAEFGIENNADFCIGIGGGSPLDAAKAASILIRNTGKAGADLRNPPLMDAIPVIAIATTAGTGSEVTPYSILTVHKEQTKQNLPHRIFFDSAFLDAKYMLNMPDSVTVNTAVDALTHIIESYLCSNANYLSDKLCESGFAIFAECKENLQNCDLNFYSREKLLLMSTLGGICIAQTGTSLPHGMGYALTYFHDMPHGSANGILTAEYIKLCDKEKVDKMLSILGFGSIEIFNVYLKDILDVHISISREDVIRYAEMFFNNKEKLKTHPFSLNYKDIFNIYANSLL